MRFSLREQKREQPGLFYQSGMLKTTPAKTEPFSIIHQGQLEHKLIFLKLRMFLVVSQ